MSFITQAPGNAKPHWLDTQNGLYVYETSGKLNMFYTPETHVADK